MTAIKPDPKLDLLLERTIDVPRDLVWQAWTDPKHIKKWFTPKPWSTIECNIDLRPGGEFTFVMQSPEGEKFPHECCFLEIVPNEKLVWTTALLPGYRPTNKASEVPHFTAVILFEAKGTGTKYTAIARHRTPDEAKKHSDMGFHEGWGTVVDQLVEMIKKM